MSAVCLVHLVWAPLGVEPLQRFLRSYNEHPPGLDHELMVVLNGFGKRELPQPFSAALGDVAHSSVRPLRPLQDLAAYRLAAQQATRAEAVCFLNSHSAPLVDGWLALLHAQLQGPAIGLVGATGSHESTFSSAPRPLKPLRRRQYPPFPNPHVRTNSFMVRRADMLELDWSVGRSKSSAHQLESGNASITRQLQARGLAPRLVDRAGRGFAPDEWPVSRTFRSGAQEGLLVDDNRTRQYADAPPQERARLARMAWGDAVDRVG